MSMELKLNDKIVLTKFPMKFPITLVIIKMCMKLSNTNYKAIAFFVFFVFNKL